MVVVKQETVTENKPLEPVTLEMVRRVRREQGNMAAEALYQTWRENCKKEHDELKHELKRQEYAKKLALHICTMGTCERDAKPGHRFCEKCLESVERSKINQAVRKAERRKEHAAELLAIYQGLEEPPLLELEHEHDVKTYAVELLEQLIATALCYEAHHASNDPDDFE